MTRQVVKTVGGAALVSGALGAAAPKQLASLFGVQDTSPDAVLLMRLYCLGNAVLGINLVRAGEAEHQRLLAVAALVDGLSAAAALASPVSGRTKSLLVVALAPVAGLAGAAWLRSRAAA